MTQTSERELRFEDRMRDADALAWSIEKDPMLRSTIIAVLGLDRAPKRALMAERLERGSQLVPRLRQRVMSSPWSLAPPRWGRSLLRGSAASQIARLRHCCVRSRPGPELHFSLVSEVTGT